MGYTFYSKKAFLFWNLFISCWIMMFLGYFICVARRYHHALRDKSLDGKKGDDEEKKDEKKEEEPEKKDDA
jgi:hypothetical protein